MACELNFGGIEEAYISLLNINDIAAYALDAEGKFIFISPVIERISGHQCCDLAGKPFAGFVVPEKGRSLDDLFEDNDGRAVRQEAMISCLDASVKKCIVTNHRIHGAADIASIGIISISQGMDLEAEEKIRTFAIAVEQSPATVVITDKNGSIEYVNPKFTHLTGYSFSDAIGQNPRILKSGAQPPEFYRELWSIISSGKEWRGEFHNRKKNDELYWESASISPIVDKNGDIAHYVAVKEDITDRKRAEDALRISEEALRKKNAEMERELASAKVVVGSLLPEKPPAAKDLALDFRYAPLDAIGGDFFSFNSLQERGLGVFIGDLVGHGVSAALFLSLLKSVTDRINGLHGNNPGQYIKELNRELYQNNIMLFLTALYGYFDFSMQDVAFRFAKGGHLPPIFFSSADGSTRQLRSNGMPIGLSPTAEFEETRAILKPGDRIYIYTDGITEVRNADKIMIEPEGLESIIAKTGQLSLSESLDHIIREVDRFRGSEKGEDDLIIIGCESLRHC